MALSAAWRLKADANANCGSDNLHTGGVLWNSAAIFNGTDSHILSEGAKSLYSFIQNTRIFTISLWFMPTAINDPVVQYPLISTRYSGTDKSFWVNYVKGTSHNRLGMSVGNGTAESDYLAAAGSIATAGIWYYVGFTGENNNTNGNKLYKNGLYHDQNNQVAASTGDSTRVLSIGSAYNETVPFNGRIKDVRIATDTWTPVQVKQHYIQGRGAF
jgi:hypothetical protein